MRADTFLQYIHDHPNVTIELATIPELKTNELEVIQVLTGLAYDDYITKLNSTYQITDKGNFYLERLKR